MRVLLSLWTCFLFSCQSFFVEEPAGRRKFVIEKKWVRYLPESFNERVRKINRMSPVLYEDLVIQGNALDGVAAFTLAEGRRVWSLPIGNGIEASGYIFKDRLFISATSGQVFCLNPKTGEKYWSFDTKSENLAAPVLDATRGWVYVLAGNNVLHALKADSGQTLWAYSRPDTSFFSIRGGTQPLVKGDLVYVGFSEGSFVALNAQSGTVAWEMQINRNKKFRDVDASAVLDGERIFVSGFDDKLYALSLKGDILWRVDIGGYSPVTVDGDRIYFPSSEGQVSALKKENGELLWSYKLNQGLSTEVKLFKGLLVFGESQGSLVFLDRMTGKKIGSFEPGRGILTSPLVRDQEVFFVSGESNLYALRAQWAFDDGLEYLR